MLLIEKIELEKCFCFEKAHLINEGDNKVNMLRCFMFWQKYLLLIDIVLVVCFF